MKRVQQNDYFVHCALRVSIIRYVINIIRKIMVLKKSSVHVGGCRKVSIV